MAKEKKKMTKDQQLNIYKTLTIILMLVLIGILGKYGFEKVMEYRADNAFEQLQDMVNSSPASGTGEQETEKQIVLEPESQMDEEDIEEVEIPAKNFDWRKLHDTNEDIYAWISIPGTKVDYPILQSSVDDSYYLKNNMDGTKGYPGCIYTEMANSKDFSDFNTVIYGHNMKSGKMFRTLHEFENQSFFDNYKYIYIYTQEKILVYKIFAAYTSDDGHILNTNDFYSEDGRVAYLEKSLSMAGATGFLDETVSVPYDGHIITLSTCTSKDNQRYLVQAVLVQSGEY